MNQPIDRPKTITRTLLDSEVQKAMTSARRRTHHNLHPTLDDPIQRMCVAMEPGSYFRPHRHDEPGRWELFIALRGRVAALIFDDSGRVLERVELSPHGDVTIVEIPPRAWHTLCVLEPGSVVFESKPGPYIPLTDKNFAPWAPAEGANESLKFEAWFSEAKPGDTAPACIPRQP